MPRSLAVTGPGADPSRSPPKDFRTMVEFSAFGAGIVTADLQFNRNIGGTIYTGASSLNVLQLKNRSS
ncbi:MAG: hypothetical protein K2X87_33445 [Gemmataceae bacterium]|nr:hypothetical protein [Gemmataceae bacterium]